MLPRTVQAKILFYFIVFCIILALFIIIAGVSLFFSPQKTTSLSPAVPTPTGVPTHSNNVEGVMQVQISPAPSKPLPIGGKPHLVFSFTTAIDPDTTTLIIKKRNYTETNELPILYTASYSKDKKKLTILFQEPVEANTLYDILLLTPPDPSIHARANRTVLLHVAYNKASESPTSTP